MLDHRPVSAFVLLKTIQVYLSFRHHYLPFRLPFFRSVFLLQTNFTTFRSKITALHLLSVFFGFRKVILLLFQVLDSISGAIFPPSTLTFCLLNAVLQKLLQSAVGCLLPLLASFQTSTSLPETLSTTYAQCMEIGSL